MPAPLKSPLSAILPIITARLASVTGIDAARVLLVARESVPKLQGDADLLVRLGPPRPDPDFTPAVGRQFLGIYRTAQVTVRVVRNLDQADRDDLGLLAAGSGLLAYEELILDALQTFVPEDDAADWLSQCPLHWLPSGTPPVHATPADKGWLHSDLLFEVRYAVPSTSTGF